MEKYAVIKLQGKQYLIEEGKEFLVDKIKKSSSKAESVTPEPMVLMIADNGKIELGKPSLKESKVKLKVIKELELGEKVEIYKYKAKSRYRKHTGFRPKYTRLLTEKIG